MDQDSLLILKLKRKHLRSMSAENVGGSKYGTWVMKLEHFVKAGNYINDHGLVDVWCDFKYE